jgi:hypothetical protein
MTVDIMACLLGKKVSRAENNNKAITGTVARFVLPVRFPRASHAAVKPVRFAGGDCRLSGVPTRLPMNESMFAFADVRRRDVEGGWSKWIAGLGSIKLFHGSTFDIAKI